MRLLLQVKHGVEGPFHGNFGKLSTHLIQLLDLRNDVFKLMHKAAVILVVLGSNLQQSLHSVILRHT